MKKAFEVGPPEIADNLDEDTIEMELSPDDLLALSRLESSHNLPREEEIDGPLDVLRAGYALADLQLAVLGIDDAATRRAARDVGAAGLMGEGAERDALLAQTRALHREIDPAALPILLPALALSRSLSPWRKPLAYWWAAKRGRY